MLTLTAPYLGQGIFQREPGCPPRPSGTKSLTYQGVRKRPVDQKDFQDEGRSCQVSSSIYTRHVHMKIPEVVINTWLKFPFSKGRPLGPYTKKYDYVRISIDTKE